MIPGFLHTEKEAAALLGVSVITLRRERQAGQIGYLKIRCRVRYTNSHLSEYLTRNERCPTLPSESDSIFSGSVPTQMRGAHAIMMQKQDKQNEHLSAQMFFKRRK